jgi:hypothetical protein
MMNRLIYPSPYESRGREESVLIPTAFWLRPPQGGPASVIISPPRGSRVSQADSPIWIGQGLVPYSYGFAGVRRQGDRYYSSLVTCKAAQLVQQIKRLRRIGNSAVGLG